MRRTLRILKFGAIGVFALISVGLIWLAVANAPANAQLETINTKVRAAGEPVTLADLAANPPAPDKNAATYIERAKDGIQAINQEVHEVWRTEEARLQELGQEVPESFDYSSTMIDAYRQAFAAQPDVMPLLIQASECPEYFPDLNYQTESGSKFVADMLPAVQRPRAAMRVLNYQVRLLLSEGKRDEALDTSLAMLRLSNLLSRAPALVGQLVAIALRSVSNENVNRVLRDGPLSREAHGQVEAELVRQDIRAAFRYAVLTERPVGMAHFNDYRLLPYTSLPHGKRDQVSYHKLMDVLIANADRPYGDADADAGMQTVLKDAGPLTKGIVPAIEAIQEAITRNEAQVRCLRVLNALLAREEDDVQDVQLSDLGLPEEATIDPFNGEPLNLKHTDDGWLIYSVGRNLKDDGGLLDENVTDVGYGPVKRGS